MEMVKLIEATEKRMAAKMEMVKLMEATERRMAAKVMTEARTMAMVRVKTSGVATLSWATRTVACPPQSRSASLLPRRARPCPRSRGLSRFRQASRARRGFGTRSRASCTRSFFLGARGKCRQLEAHFRGEGQEPPRARRRPLLGPSGCTTTRAST